MSRTLASSTAVPTLRRSVIACCGLPRPAQRALEPVGLVGQIGHRRLELAFEQGGEVLDLAGDPGLVDHALADQPGAVDLGDRRVLADRRVHERLGEARLVALIVAEAAVAPHVDDDVAVELLPIFDGELAGEGHRLGIVAVDVEDRRLDALGDVGRVRRRARELRRGGEADLVVDDEMEAAAGGVAGDAREAEAFGDDALAGEGGVAVEQHRQDEVALDVAAGVLLGLALAEHDRIDRLEMAGVGQQREMDLDVVELAVGRGAEMIFDVARAADILGVGGAAGELGEDRAEGLAHDVGEHVEAAAMGHADDDLLDPVLAAIFDHRLERRHHRFAAVEAEALGADIFAGEELLPLLALDDLGEDRLLALGGEADRGLAPLHPLLEEAALLEVVDVHIFEAELAAIIAPQHLDDLAHGGGLEAERTVEKDRPVERVAGEAVKFGGEIGGELALDEAERVEIGGEVAAHPVGADQHHRPDRIAGGLDDLGLRPAGRGRCLGRLGGDALDRHARRIEAGIDLVQLDQRPIVACPARARLTIAVNVHFDQPSHVRNVHLPRRFPSYRRRPVSSLDFPARLGPGLRRGDNRG